MNAASPTLQFMIFLITLLLGLTGFAIYLSFGPPANKLEEPWDRQED